MNSADHTNIKLGGKNMFKKVILLFYLFLVFAASASAQEVDECRSEWGVSCSGMRISICPQGDFDLIRNACGGIGDYIWVCAMDVNGNGIPGIPVSDYYLLACDPSQDLCLCVNPVIADSPTNADGYTTISGGISGGGCVLVNGLALAVQGKIILDEWFCIDMHCEDIIIVSPDLTADCQVTLSDLAVFSLSYNKECGNPGYNDCCDYNGDCKSNLSDFAHMGEHYQH
jgi:hypothetical protein